MQLPGHITQASSRARRQAVIGEITNRLRSQAGAGVQDNNSQCDLHRTTNCGKMRHNHHALCREIRTDSHSRGLCPSHSATAPFLPGATMTSAQRWGQNHGVVGTERDGDAALDSSADAAADDLAPAPGVRHGRMDEQAG